MFVLLQQKKTKEMIYQKEKNLLKKVVNTAIVVTALLGMTLTGYGIMMLTN